MPLPLRKGDFGPLVREVQTLLVDKGFLTDEEVNGIFDQETYRAVRAFQAQNLDENGVPLAVDGKVGELNARAGEIGGNNCGSFVRKYLAGLAAEGNPWCAGFVSFCFDQAPGGIPFSYSVGARDILRQFKQKGWRTSRGATTRRSPVMWWCGGASSRRPRGDTSASSIS